MRITRIIGGSCLLALAICSVAPSDDKPSLDKNAESVGKVLASLAAAYSARDPNALAEVFTPQGEFIDADENVFQGREAISREFTVLFEINPHNSVEIVADGIREISPGILSVACVATFSTGAGKQASGASETVTVDFAALVVRQADGRWLMASIRSEGERLLHTPHARLTELEWLIGEWVDESNESTMHTNTRWSDDGQFILSDFAIHVAGRKVMNGTQRIGWDGSLGKFKSWVFDSEGGHAECIWTELDDRWVVKSTGVRPDGDVCSATQTYERKGSDSYVFTVTDRIIGDEVATDFTSQVVRKPPEPETAAAATPRRN